MSRTIRLNIGAGETTIPGFLSVDIQNGTDASKPLQYHDGSVTEIYCSHTLEHIHHSKTQHVLWDFARVLQPGGRLRLAIPDFDRLLAEFNAGILPESDFNAWLHGSMDVEHDRHVAFFGRARIESLLKSAGFEDIAEFEPEYKDCSHIPHSLNLTATKRKVKIKENPTVCMVLSTPRFGPVDFYLGIIETARVLGWNFLPWGGTEWGKGLTGSVNAALGGANCLTFGAAMDTLVNRDRPDYIMVMDYDSVFSPDDCMALLKLMQENPDYGAIYPVEAHRHCDGPLGWDSSIEYNEVDDITQVVTGHFGCTIIRREVLEKLPKPYFVSMPNPQTGEWRESLDADIAFWMMMGIHGWKVGQANHIHIGHMEFCVKWLSARGALWQPIQAWRKTGKPDKAVFDPAFWNKLAKNLKPGEYPPVASQVVTFPDDSVAPAPKPSGALAAANLVLRQNGLPEINDRNLARPPEPPTEIVKTCGVCLQTPCQCPQIRADFDAAAQPLADSDVLAECDRLAERRQHAMANGKV